MNFLELARQRFSVRKFAQRPVEEENIQLILQAAQLAPSGKNQQSARILILDEKEALEKLKGCTPCHYHAPLAFLICYDSTVGYTREVDGESSGPVDAAIAGTHMMLEAFDIGLGSTWAMGFNPGKMREAYAIPERIIPVSLLVCGYPAENVVPDKRHTQYQPLEVLCRRNSFE
jgi:nitroreductase